jgi:acetyl-CoA carboxylase biotin carboxyl carrier protein
MLGSPLAMPTNVQAHITGTVWKIEVKAGESVDEGQTLVIIESMKMEMPVESPIKGRVEQIAVTEGQAVDEGAVLLTIA